MPQPWNRDIEDYRLAELHAAGTSLHAIAKEMGRSKETVARHAKRLGLSWDRDNVVAATKAKTADAKARRATLKLQLLDDAERLRAQLWQSTTYFEWGGKDHTYAEKTVDEPTPTDKLKLMQATSTAIGSYDRLEKLDADAGTTEAVGMLDQIAAAIGAAADALRPGEDPQ